MPRSAPYDRDVALDAAMSLFWTKGYHATSLKDIEGALEMKPGSIYSAFSSKSNLYLLALERYFEFTKMNFLAMISESVSPLKALGDKLRDFATLPADHEQAQICMLMKTLIDTQATDSEISDCAKVYISDLCDIFASIFDKAKSLGELPIDVDSDRLARRYQAAIMVLRFKIYQGSPQIQLIELAEDLAQEFERMRCAA